MEWLKLDNCEIRIGISLEEANQATQYSYFKLVREGLGYSISLLESDHDSQILDNFTRLAGSKRIFIDVKGFQEPEDAVHVYFGNHLTEINPSLLVNLFKEKDVGWDHNRWISRVGSKKPGHIGWFVNNFWGVGLLRFVILTKRKTLLRLTRDSQVQFLLSARYDNWRKEIYDRLIREEFSFRDSANPFSAIKNNAVINDESRLSSKLSDTELHKSIIDKLIKVEWLIQDINLHPVVKLVSKFNQLEGSMISELYSDLDYEDIADVEWERNESNIIIKTCIVEILDNSANVRENQMVLLATYEFVNILSYQLKNVSEKIENLREFIQKYGNEHEAFRSTITDELKWFEWVGSQYLEIFARFEHLAEDLKSRHDIKLEELTHFLSTNVTEYDVRYSELLSIHELLFSKLIVSKLDKGIFEFETGALQSLYQKWCTREFISVMQSEKLGLIKHEKDEQEFVQGNFEAVSSFFHKKDVDLVINVYTEKRYNKYSDFGDAYGVVTKPHLFNSLWVHDIETNVNAPDISIEIFHPKIMNGKYPFIITLDPTLSSSQHKYQKSKYLRSIFCFDLDFQDENDAPSPIVKAAWAIYPGILKSKNLGENESLLKKEFNDELNKTAKRGKSSFQKGGILLFPGCDVDLASIITKIIKHTILDPYNIDIKT
jgi:hypothetical protein